jgi:cytochrome c peroxidase
MCLVTLLSCQDKRPYHLELPVHFPDITVPEDNQITHTRVALGAKLFFDPILSLDSSLACTSCHLPDLAFTDGKAISLGIEGRPGKRNAPSLLNVAYLDKVNKDGGVKTLDLQALVPIEDENEMGISILKLSERLNLMPQYVSMAEQAYGRKPDAFVVTRALASFLRTLYSGNSPYDRWLNGDSLALTKTQQEGLALFESKKLNCTACHGGFNFTNNTFENNGLYGEYEDIGRALITMDSSDTGKFRVPSLRNVAITAPYMHDGSLTDLTSVIDHYMSIQTESRPLKSPLLYPFHLNAQEKEALISFLEALTDDNYQAEE